MISIDVLGSLKNQHEIKVFFNAFPDAMTETMRRWLFRVKKRYVGNSKKDGSYVSWLKRKKLKGRPGRWSKEAAGSFKGFVKNPKNIDNMKLIMGIPEKSDSSFVQGLHMMSTGGGSITSSKYMPIPMKKNLARKNIINKFYKNFKEKVSGEDLQYMQNGSRVYWFDPDIIEEGGDLYDATMYLGLKKVTLPNINFKFEEKFLSLWPRMVELGNKRFERKIRSIKKGFIKGR